MYRVGTTFTRQGSVGSLPIRMRSSLNGKDTFRLCWMQPTTTLDGCWFSSYHNHNHHHQQQSRYNDTGRRRRRSRPSSGVRMVKKNPYDVLGVPRDASADVVKRKFLQLALRHHPDTNRHATNEEENKSTDTFVKIREAFERIKQDFGNRHDGEEFMASSSWLTEEEFDAWFYEETGQKMDASTRREVMHVYRSGLTRTEYGAVWEIAFILEEEGFFANKEKSLPHHSSCHETNATDGGADKDGSSNTCRDMQRSKSRRKRSF